MNRKILSMILLLILLFTTSYTFADLDESLKGHWAEEIVDREFINKHFKYLFDEQNTFNPDNSITQEQFMTSLYSLIKEFYPSLPSEDINQNIKEDILLRKDAVKLIVKSLENMDQLELETLENSYTDLENLQEEDISYILKASSLGIVNGYLDNTFKPDKPVTQIEAIIILKRMEGKLNMLKNIIPFNVASSNKTYNLKEETIKVQESKDKVIINITKEFPTSGYSMNIDKIVKQSKGEYNIYLIINKPNPGSITLQVITYQTLTIEIDKKYLDEGKYNFILIPEDNSFKTLTK